jgi:hypothetical protein
LSLLTSKAINCPNPRDDVVELLETGVKKSNDLSPSDMWEQMGELQTLASRLHGTVQSPDESTLKTLFIRAMPTDLRNSLALQGMDALSSLDDIKKHLDTADAIYQQKHKGSSSNRTSSSNNNTQSNNSREHVLAAAATTAKEAIEVVKVKVPSHNSIPGTMKLLVPSIVVPILGVR